MSSLDEALCAEASVLVILSKMTHFFSSFVNFLLKISQPGHLLLLPLHLLMDDL
jgi:hypothetical protein